MYEKYYKIKNIPFSITADPNFVYETPNFHSGFVNLLYGIEKKEGPIIVTGEIGSGKTTLCKMVIKEVLQKEPDKKVAVILNPLLLEREMLKNIIHAFKKDEKQKEVFAPAPIIEKTVIKNKLGKNPTLFNANTSKKAVLKTKVFKAPIPLNRNILEKYNLDNINEESELLDILSKFLQENKSINNHAILIIDDSQMLSIRMLEYISILSNLEKDGKKLLQIMLFGQPELNDKLSGPELKHLNQRVSVRHRLYYLDKKETHHYINHRLNKAKAARDIKFTNSAINKIYSYSKGCQRLINHVCDRALLRASVEESKTIDKAIVVKGIKSFLGDNPSRPAHFSFFQKFTFFNLKPSYRLTLLIIFSWSIGIVTAITGFYIYNQSLFSGAQKTGSLYASETKKSTENKKEAILSAAPPLYRKNKKLVDISDLIGEKDPESPKETLKSP